MGRSLDNFDGVPSMKFRNQKDMAVFAVAHCKVVPQTEMDSGEPKLNDDGTPKMQEVLRCLYISGNAVFADGDNDAACVPGEQYDLYIHGPRRWDFSQAKKDMKKANAGRGFEVGDICQVIFSGTRPPKNRGYAPIKVWAFKLRHPKPEEAQLAQMCDEIDEALERSGERAAPRGRGRPADAYEGEGNDYDRDQPRGREASDPGPGDQTMPFQDDDIPFALLAALGSGLVAAWLAVQPVLSVWA